MTAPETLTVSSKRPLTTGRRPDKTGVRAKADKEPFEVPHLNQPISQALSCKPRYFE